MGVQNRHARMPLPPANVARRPYPILWDTRTHMLALSRHLWERFTFAWMALEIQIRAARELSDPKTRI